MHYILLYQIHVSLLQVVIGKLLNVTLGNYYLYVLDTLKHCHLLSINYVINSILCSK